MNSSSSSFISSPKLGAEVSPLNGETGLRRKGLSVLSPAGGRSVLGSPSAACKGALRLGGAADWGGFNGSGASDGGAGPCHPHVASVTLTQLCACIQDALQAQLDPTYRVQAEIAALSVRNGHAYLELVDRDAKVRATCWRNTWAPLADYFLQTTGQNLQPGMHVLLEVSVDYHPTYGLSLQIHDIDPNYTLGEQLLQRRQTIARLQQAGLMDLQPALTLPTLPFHIAVISSPDAAGYQDFLHQLSTLNANHSPLTANRGLAASVKLFPAIMQGEQCPASIIHALDQIYDYAFNSPSEVEGVPAVPAEESVLGSPSAARKGALRLGKAVDRGGVNGSGVSDGGAGPCQSRVASVVVIRGGGATTDLSCFDDYQLCEYCANFPIPIISGIGHTRDVSVLDLVCFHAVKTPTAAAEFFLSRLATLNSQLSTLNSQLTALLTQGVTRQQHRLDLLQKTVELHSPEHIFRKGYSLLTLHGSAVKSVSDLAPGQTLTAHFLDGQATLTPIRT